MDAFVINLKRRPDRLKSVKLRFESVGIRISRFDAFDARDLKPSGDLPIVSPSVMACWVSHESLLEKIGVSSEKYSLVLEDDAVPTGRVDWPAFMAALPLAMNKNNLGYLQIGFISSHYGLTRTGVHDRISAVFAPSVSLNLELDRPRKATLGSSRSGSHAYVVSRDFARFLTQLNRPCWCPTDGFFDRVSSSLDANGLFPRMARLSRSVVDQDSRRDKSDITDSDIN